MSPSPNSPRILLTLTLISTPLHSHLNSNPDLPSAWNPTLHLPSCSSVIPCGPPHSFPASIAVCSYCARFCAFCAVAARPSSPPPPSPLPPLHRQRGPLAACMLPCALRVSLRHVSLHFTLLHANGCLSGFLRFANVLSVSGLAPKPPQKFFFPTSISPQCYFARI